MGKPRMIILIRHAQSEGNKNRSIHQHTPDHRVKLTPEGRNQAHAAGLKLRALLLPSDTLHFFTSPYRRTRETTEGILSSLTSNDPRPSPFPRHTIKVHEEPRLREQDFGNFQPDSEEMARMWEERANYGHFFYRIPNGESAADAYDRISGFNESLWRSFGEESFASVCVLVTHGLMTRVFLMKWYHFSVEYFEDLRNVNHCEFIVMRRNEDSGKYILQNQLRTWSELRREQKMRERKLDAEPSSPEIPVRKKWAGCRAEDEDGDGTGRQTKRVAGGAFPPRRQNTADLFFDEREERSGSDDGEDHAMQMDDGKVPSPSRQNPSTTTEGRPNNSVLNNSSATISPCAFLRIGHTGRDGGGTLSGAGSEEDEDQEEDENEANNTTNTNTNTNSKSRITDPGPRTSVSSPLSSPSKSPQSRSQRPRSSLAMALKGELQQDIDDDDGGDEPLMKADALGDQSDVDENSPTAKELRRMKKEDQSFGGSVR